MIYVSTHEGNLEKLFVQKRVLGVIFNKDNFYCSEALFEGTTIHGLPAWPYGTSLPFASLLHLGNTFLMTNSSRRIDHTFTSKITEEPLEYDLKLPKNHWNDIKSLVKSAGIRSKISEEHRNKI